VQLPDVAGAALVIDDADDHEERSLEQAVGDQHRAAGCGGLGTTDADQDHHEPELADGAEREHLLEVERTQRAKAARDHRGEPHGDHERPPDPDVGERRRQAGDQVDAHLHHRRRVQVRADRRGGHHRRRQPAVERVLRRLRERADQDEHQGDRDDAAVRGGRDDLTEPVRPRRLPEQHEPGEHHQAAHPGHEQGVQRRPARPLVTIVEADQQVRRDRRELPAHVQQQQVVGEHQRRHRAGEQREEPGGPTGSCVVVEVAQAVREHQRPDARHEHEHQDRERVQPEVEAQPELGDPCAALRERITVEHPAGARRHPHHDGERSQPADGEAATAQASRRHEHDGPEGRMEPDERGHHGAAASGGGAVPSDGRRPGEGEPARPMGTKRVRICSRGRSRRTPTRLPGTPGVEARPNHAATHRRPGQGRLRPLSSSTAPRTSPMP
jgi:hypothetical protein